MQTENKHTVTVYTLHTAETVSVLLEYTAPKIDRCIVLLDMTLKREVKATRITFRFFQKAYLDKSNTDAANHHKSGV